MAYSAVAIDAEAHQYEGAKYFPNMLEQSKQLASHRSKHPKAEYLSQQFHLYQIIKPVAGVGRIFEEYYTILVTGEPLLNCQ